ncbi:hypothetical protein BJ508DRAFT_412391 [Ascobolus immersus RN42]|uniref:Small ribosomal subunit protein mS29 n=1 Tax=Ascobolus immersus RN42 TaxID=1160509 RepID=A0A3N4ILB3_ASCIM|nr:hypothetical protein BJ508DRAFT_412391 [Ascobolus immersus RN42]
MSSALRQLPRHLHLPAQNSSLIRCFTTTSSPLARAPATGAKKKATNLRAIGNNFAKKRNNKDDSPKARYGKPGEARAMKRMVVLSSTHALSVPTPTFNADAIHNPAESWGKMMSFNGGTLAKLKGLDAFQPRRNWEFFNAPNVLYRRQTMELAKLMTWIEGVEMDAEGVKMVEKNWKLLEEEFRVAEIEKEVEKEFAGYKNKDGSHLWAFDTENNGWLYLDEEIKDKLVGRIRAEHGWSKEEWLAELNNDAETWWKLDPALAKGVDLITEAKPDVAEDGKLFEELVEVRAKHERDPERLIVLGKQTATGGRQAGRIFDGKHNSGKSVMLLQAMAWALERNWVVIAVPEARDLTISHTDYEQDPATNLWLQREYLCTLLQKTLAANSAVLSATKLTLPASKAFMKNATAKQPPTLSTLLQLGAENSSISHEVFNAFLAELSTPTSPPVLFTLDNLNQICAPTAYRDPDFNQIHGFDLSLPATFLAYLTGEKSFNKGLILGATSLQSPPPLLTLKTVLNPAVKRFDPYGKFDWRVIEKLKNVKVVNVDKINETEGKAVLEYVDKSGLLKDEVGVGLIRQDMFKEKFVVSCGNLGDLYKICLLPRSM